MSTTIDSLDIQITTSAGQSAANIEKLADALGKLRANSKLTSVTNNLGKLKTALDGLQGTSGAIRHLDKLSQAMQSLSGLQKLTGLNSAMNALKKLPDVMNGLDATKLEEFRKKMEKLANALAPLATKINTISKGFSKLPSKITSAVTATNRMAAASQNTKKGFDMSSLGLMALISNYSALISVVNQAIQVVANSLAQAVEWDGIQFRFGRAFGEDAEETYAYIEKINEALGINIQQFMQYSSLYGSLLSGFGMAQDKVTTISVGLTELSYDIWAAYNDRFKTLEDASEAVRSAITGEIEPIRNAGIALTEASLQEFIDQTHLAGVSIEKLTEAQKSEVRYAAMVNAAMSQGIVGTYAREMQTAEGAVRSLSQSFKGLVQALGSLFIPLLQTVVPYVTAFVELITDAVFWLAELFGIPIQKIDWGTPSKGVGGVAEGAKEATSGLNSATDAAKKLKKYTMGFDELNVIDPDTGASAGGAGAGGAAGDSGWGSGLDLGTLWDDSVFDEASKKVDEIKQKILDFADKWKWALGLAGAAATAFVGHKLWTLFAKTTIGAALISGVKKVAGELKAFFSLLKESGNLPGTLAAAFPKLSNAITKVSTAIKSLGALNLAGWGAAIAVVITAVASVVYFLYENWDKVTKAVKNFLKENIGPKLEDIKSHFSDLKEALGPVGDLFKKIYDKAKEFIENINWSSIGALFEAVGGVIFSVVGGVIATAFNVLVGMIENVIQVFTGLSQIVSGVVQLIVAIFKGDFQGIVDSTKLITEGIENLWDGLVGFVVGIVEDFVEGIASWFANLSKELLGEYVPDMIDGIVDWFLSLPEKILTPIKNFTSNVLKAFKNLWTNVKSWWSTSVQPKFTKEYWKNKFDVIRTAISTKLAEAKTAISDKWNDVKSMFNQSIAPKFTKEYWKNKFDTIRSAIGSKLAEAKSAISEKWSDIKSWFSTNIAPKFTKDHWKTKFDGIKTGISSKLSEVKTAISEKWADVKTWFSTNIAPKFTKEHWKTKFDGIKTGLKAKLDEAWTAVKDFFSAKEWKKKVDEAVKAIKENFKMPTLPKIKLDVTWDTNVGSVKKAVYEALGLEGWPKLEWSTYATGGFPKTGEAFIARESGPELVGKIGNRTSVANNEQIVSAVSQGVYQAVSSAMSEMSRGGEQPVIVYLDGKQIYSSVKKTEARRGVNLMGNQVGYVY